MEKSNFDTKGKIIKWEFHEPPEIVLQVHERQVQQLYHKAWIHNLGTTIVAILACLSIWEKVNQSSILIWLLIFIAINLIRWIIAIRFTKVAPSGKEIYKWVNIQLSGIIISAFFFGLPAVFLWPTDAPEKQMVWIISITAITAATVARYCVWKLAYVPFICLSFLPITIRLFVEGGFSYNILGILGLVFIAVLLQTGHMMYTANLENILVGIKNKQLNIDLSSENEKAKILNEKLVHEIEERERANKIVRQQEIELKQARHMEAIGTLASGIAHEINTPAQFISSNLDFVLGAFPDLVEFIRECMKFSEKEYSSLERKMKVESLQDSFDIDFLLDEIPKALNQSVDGIEQVSKIVLSMKQFAHPGEENKVDIDVNEAISNTATVCRSEWKHTAEIDFRLDLELPLVPCHRSMLNQVILIIIVNAAHAIETNKKPDNEKGLIVISTWQEDDDSVCISITDNGGGIPQNNKERIFDPFFTTKEPGKGTGQGLSIAHSIITEKHNGDLSVDSIEGKGATFLIKLPLAK